MINKDDVLFRTNNGLDIIEHIYRTMGTPFKGLNKPNLNPFYNDTRPSVSFNDVNGSILYKDFGNENYKGDVFDFASHYYDTTNFNELLKMINTDLHLNVEETDYYKPVVKPFTPPPKKTIELIEGENFNNDLYYAKNTQERLYRVAVNKRVVNKNLDPSTLEPYENFYAYSRYFVNKRLTVNQIAEAVKQGFTIAPFHLKIDAEASVLQSKKKRENWEASELIVLDFDSGLFTIDDALNHPLIEEAGILLYTTVNHKPEQNRFRVLIALDFVVTDSKHYETIIEAVINEFNVSNEIVDPQCKDAARAYYGNTEAIIYNLIKVEA